MDRHAILSALKRATLKEIEVAGAKFHIRGLTGAERMRLGDRIIAAKSDPSQKLPDAELCSWAICGPDGERLYQDASELSEVDGAALETIARAILEASNLTNDAQERAAGESPASPS